MKLVGSIRIQPSVSTLSVIFLNEVITSCHKKSEQFFRNHYKRHVTILNLVPEKLSANGKTDETDCRFTQEGFSYIAE